MVLDKGLKKQTTVLAITTPKTQMPALKILFMGLEEFVLFSWSQETQKDYS
jgi:hypothetical protein